MPPGISFHPWAKRLSIPPSAANSTCVMPRWPWPRRVFTVSAPEVIQTALTSFEGIARRQEGTGVKARGVTVIDDFGHHPTAIRETLSGLRHRFPGHRLWAVFEPRSNTTRRAVFQQQLPEALQLARAEYLLRRSRPSSKSRRSEILDPAAVVAAIEAAGRPAFYERDAAAIVERYHRRFCGLTTSSPPSSATAASTGFTRNCWRSWQRCSVRCRSRCVAE